jgi:hypothetical protein
MIHPEGVSPKQKTASMQLSFADGKPDYRCLRLPVATAPAGAAPAADAPPPPADTGATPPPSGATPAPADSGAAPAPQGMQPEGAAPKPNQ